MPKFNIRVILGPLSILIPIEAPGNSIFHWNINYQLEGWLFQIAYPVNLNTIYKYFKTLFFNKIRITKIYKMKMMNYNNDNNNGDYNGINKIIN